DPNRLRAAGPQVQPARLAPGPQGFPGSAVGPRHTRLDSGGMSRGPAHSDVRGTPTRSRAEDTPRVETVRRELDRGPRQLQTRRGDRGRGADVRPGTASPRDPAHRAVRGRAGGRVR